MKLRIVSLAVSLLVLLGIMGCFLYKADWADASEIGLIGCVTGILTVMLSLGLPPLISLILAAICRRPASQIILAAASLFYGVWFVLFASVIPSEPHQPDIIQAVIVFVLLFLFVLPVLLTMLAIVAFLEISRLLTKKESS